MHCSRERQSRESRPEQGCCREKQDSFSGCGCRPSGEGNTCQRLKPGPALQRGSFAEQRALSPGCHQFSSAPSPALLSHQGLRKEEEIPVHNSRRLGWLFQRVPPGRERAQTAPGMLVALGWEQRGWRSSAGLSTAGITPCNLSCPKICQLWCVWL